MASSNVVDTLKLPEVAEWVDLAEDWLTRRELEHKAGRGLSKNSLALYRAAVIGTFVPWLARTGWRGGLDGVTAEHVNEYMSYLLDEKSKATASVYRAALKGFWKWLKERGEVTEDIFKAREILRVHVDAPVVQPLTIEEIEKLVRAAKRDKVFGPRNLALLALMLDSGLRVFEVAALDVEDVVKTARKVMVRHGKGNRQREASYTVDTADDLNSYLRWRTKRLANTKHGKRGEEVALFIGRNGERLSTSAIRGVLHQLGEAIGIPGLHPHQLRHTSFSQAALDGADEWAIRRQGGWSDTSSMPLRYTKQVQQERALQVMQKHGVMNRVRH